MGKGISHKTCSLHIFNEKRNKGKWFKDYDKRFYQCWCDIRQRTTNPNNKSWKDYGGRGIVSDDYKYFVDFYDDMYESYLEHVNIYGLKDTTIDRKDCNGNYTKDNLRWATRKEQEDNRLLHYINNIAISPEGTRYIFNNIKDFSNEHNLSKENVSACLRGISKTHKGWKFYKEV